MRPAHDRLRTGSAGQPVGGHGVPQVLLRPRFRQEPRHQHDGAEPDGAPARRRRGLHRVHHTRAVHRQTRSSQIAPVRGDEGVAQARQQVAERALAPVRVRRVRRRGVPAVRRQQIDARPAAKTYDRDGTDTAARQKRETAATFFPHPRFRFFL